MGKKHRAAALILLAITGSVLLFALPVLPRPAQQARPARQAAQSTEELTGRVICLDPGHGGSDGGARARDSKTWEKAINLKVAEKLRDALLKRGASVIMTRETDATFDEKNKRADLSARMKVAADNNADLFLSIHMNEYRTRRESGPQVFYRKEQEQSRLLAGCLQSALIDGLAPKKERVAMAGDYYVLSSNLPSVLIECGFISNAEEEKLLLDESYQTKVAEAISIGVIEYFSLPKAE